MRQDFPTKKYQSTAGEVSVSAACVCACVVPWIGSTPTNLFRARSCSFNRTCIYVCICVCAHTVLPCEASPVCGHSRAASTPSTVIRHRPSPARCSRPVYMHTCVHAYMCTCVHVYMCTVYMCTCVHVYMFTCMYRMHVCIQHARMHTCIHVCMYACMQVRMYACMYCVVRMLSKQSDMYACIPAVAAATLPQRSLTLCMARASRPTSYAIAEHENIHSPNIQTSPRSHDVLALTKHF